jgi:hypothetical protein
MCARLVLGGRGRSVAYLILRCACGVDIQDTFDLFVWSGAYNGDAFRGICLRDISCCIRPLYEIKGQDRQIAARNVKCLRMLCRGVQSISKVAQERRAFPS